MNSSTVIVSNVFSLLREFYEAYGFRWEYRNFFARLLNCSPNAPFARAAEFFMRVEYPGFQRRDAFFRWGTEMILSAVHRQAAAVEAMCQRGEREEWALLDVAGANGRPVAIYALHDPDTDATHYVGLTVEPTTRFNAHCEWCLSEDRSKDRWLRPIIQAGKRPRLEFLDWVPDHRQHEAERHWIQLLRDRGEPLTNSSCF